MRKHLNPHRITDPNNIFEVGENSSHPELDDSIRIWKFKGHTFTSATEAAKFFEQEGLDPKHYDIRPRSQRDIGRNKITIEIIPRGAVPSGVQYRRLREA